MTTRDVAKRRLRRTTQLTIAATIVIGGVFASLAAGSTHFTKHIARQTRRVTTAKAIVQAPAPPIVAVQSSSSAAASAPSVAPAVTSQAPVVVSGGS